MILVVGIMLMLALGLRFGLGGLGGALGIPGLGGSGGGGGGVTQGSGITGSNKPDNSTNVGQFQQDNKQVQDKHTAAQGDNSINIGTLALDSEGRTAAGLAAILGAAKPGGDSFVSPRPNSEAASSATVAGVPRTAIYVGSAIAIAAAIGSLVFFRRRRRD